MSDGPKASRLNVGAAEGEKRLSAVGPLTESEKRQRIAEEAGLGYEEAGYETCILTMPDGTISRVLHSEFSKCIIFFNYGRLVELRERKDGLHTIRKSLKEVMLDVQR